MRYNHERITSNLTKTFSGSQCDLLLQRIETGEVRRASSLRNTERALMFPSTEQIINIYI